METEYEKILIDFHKEQMIGYLNDHPEEFEQAVNLALSDKQPYAWRSAWVLWGLMHENDQRLKPYIGKILTAMPAKKDGHQRELMKIVQNMELSDEEEGMLFDYCIGVWEKIGKKPSVRYHAMKTILKFVDKYPELATELKYLTQEHYLEGLSGGIKRAIKKMIAPDE